MSKKQDTIPSFDEIRAMLAESAEASIRRGEEFDRRLAESAEASTRRGEEFDRRLAESAREAAEWRKEEAEWRKEEAERRKEADARQKKLDEQLDKLDKQIGGLSNNIGHHAEQFFQDALAQTLTFGGEKYDYMTPNVTCKKKGNHAEFDILLVNGKSVAIIEAKNRIHPSDVLELAEKRLAKFREFFIEYKNHKVYLGIAGFSFSKAVLEQAQKYGMGIIRQVGEAIEVEADHLKAY